MMVSCLYIPAHAQGDVLRSSQSQPASVTLQGLPPRPLWELLQEQAVPPAASNAFQVPVNRKPPNLYREMYREMSEHFSVQISIETTCQ
jgi:hypothetical protein